MVNSLLILLELIDSRISFFFFHAHCVEERKSIRLGEKIIKIGVVVRNLWGFKVEGFSFSAPSSVFSKQSSNIFIRQYSFSSGSTDSVRQSSFHPAALILSGSAVFIRSRNFSSGCTISVEFLVPSIFLHPTNYILLVPSNSLFLIFFSSLFFPFFVLK